MRIDGSDVGKWAAWGAGVASFNYLFLMDDEEAARYSATLPSSIVSGALFGAIAKVSLVAFLALMEYGGVRPKTTIYGLKVFVISVIGLAGLERANNKRRLLSGAALVSLACFLGFKWL